MHAYSGGCCGQGGSAGQTGKVGALGFWQAVAQRLRAHRRRLTAAAPAPLERWLAAPTGRVSQSQTPHLIQHKPGHEAHTCGAPSAHTHICIQPTPLHKQAGAQLAGIAVEAWLLATQRHASATRTAGLRWRQLTHLWCAPAGAGRRAWWWPSPARSPSPSSCPSAPAPRQHRG